jgi:hypothetical protein
MEYLGAWGTLIHEKNLESKISCQTPFKSVADKMPTKHKSSKQIFLGTY